MPWIRVFSAGLMGLFLTAALHADDWPQWMGPRRDNIWREEGILDTFPEKGPRVLWRAPVANGYAGPAVADGRVFVTDFVPQGDLQDSNFKRKTFVGKERVQCLDAATGERQWLHEYPCTYSVSYPNGPRCTPNHDGGKVYTLGTEGNLFCLDARTGKVVWARDFKRDYGVPTPLWGFAAHPLIDGDHLICLVGGKGSVAVAFDKHTGKEIWKALTAKEPGYSPPMLIEAAGKRQLLIWHPEAINSLNPDTGEVYWSVPQETVNGTSIMAPRQLGDLVYVGAWQRKGALFQLDANQPGAKRIWKGDRDSALYPINNTPFLENAFMYGVCSDGEFRCVDLKNGERLWETYQPVAGDKAGSGTAHVVKQGDRFFIVAENGDLIIARLSPKRYEEVSRCRLIEPTSKVFDRKVAWSHPAFAQKCVFARNDQELVCVSLAK